MLEDLLLTGLPSASTLFDGGAGHVRPEAMSLSILFSGAGAVILEKFTGSVGPLTMTMNYAALFLGALTAHWALGGLNLPMDQYLQQPMLITLGGMLMGAFSMLWWLRCRAVV